MRSPHLPTLALSLTAASTIAHQTASFAQAIPESARITPVTAIEGATFGNRISIDDDWMAIGADFDAEVLGRGFVEIHRREGAGWTHHQTLLSPEDLVPDHFGLTVVLEGSRLLVGAPWDEQAGNRSGAVHLYELEGDQWTWKQKLVSSVPDNTGAHFGLNCCFGRSDDEIVVGAFLDSLEGAAEGAVWIYRHDGGSFVFDDRLSLPGIQLSAYFGKSIAVDGGMLAVGAPGLVGPSGFRHGGVALYADIDDRWVPQGVQIPAEPEIYQAYGEALDLEAGVLAVGSPFEHRFGVDSGAVHVYRIAGGVPILETVVGPGEDSTAYGLPVHLSDDGQRLATGAYLTDADSGPRAGGAWIHERGSGDWSATIRLVPSEIGSFDFFGLGLSFDDSQIAIGAPRSDLAGVDVGAVSIFDLADCDGSGRLDAWELVVDDALDLDADGLLDACEGVLGDLNGDGVVDGTDIGLFSSLWGGDGSSGGDFNGDGIVDGGDLAVILSGWRY